MAVFGHAALRYMMETAGAVHRQRREQVTSARQTEWQRAPQPPPQVTRRPMPGAPLTAGTAHTCAPHTPTLYNLGSRGWRVSTNLQSRQHSRSQVHLQSCMFLSPSLRILMRVAGSPPLPHRPPPRTGCGRRSQRSARRPPAPRPAAGTGTCRILFLA